MVVEEFSIEEVKEATVEQCDEARALVEQLGLTGQARLYRKAEAGEVAPSILPYRKMTAQEKWVYEILLPTKSKLENYADGAIPLRVLQIAAHAQSLIPSLGDDPWSLYVWHPKNADYKDPLLVMRKGIDWGAQEHYILARWGEELEEFGVMANKAKDIYKAKCVAKLEEARQQIEVWIKSADSKVLEHYLSGTGGDPSVYWH